MPTRGVAAGPVPLCDVHAMHSEWHLPCNLKGGSEAVSLVGTLLVAIHRRN